MIEVLRAGALSTVQDLGRYGQRSRGISQSGALDEIAIRYGNLLVGNPPSAAGIEFTFGPAVLRFHADAWIGLTGTDVDARIDERHLRPGWRTEVRAGQTLTLARPRNRMRTYVSVAGGICVPQALGSASTDLKAGFGGLHGRALRAGDRLGFNMPTALPSRRIGIRLPDPGTSVRVVHGPEYEQFSEGSQAALWRSEWALSPQSNRMGYRFTGPALERNTSADMASHGVFPGVIQVPPSGQPIVLLADCQTTGGYSRIGVVIAADLWKLAQLYLGATVRFTPCGVQEAREALLKRRAELARIESALHAY